MKAFFTERMKGCNYSGHCQEGFIGVSTQGDFYPCGRFIAIGEFRLGNVFEDSVEEINNHALRRKINSRRSICQREECNIKEYCNSGCAFDSYITHGHIEGKTLFCEGNREIFNHIYDTLREELLKKKLKIQKPIL